MGEDLYAEIVGKEKYDRPCRVYAPVGSHEDLLPYLVRRLLENGANTSFVNRIVDEAVAVDDIVADPLAEARAHDFQPHPRIPAPADIFGPERVNSKGINFADRSIRQPLWSAMDAASAKTWRAAPIVAGDSQSGEEVASVNPAITAEIVGVCKWASVEQVDAALDAATTAQLAWDRTPAGERAAILNKAADLFEANSAELLALCIREAGKTLPDAVSELREAVDFLRYYAVEAISLFGEPTVMPGPTGERNTYGLRGRGVFVCISPWNFPLAIFTGQIVAALAAGNAVLAKPAEQTPLIAHRAIELLLAAGIPPAVFAFSAWRRRDHWWTRSV